MYRCGYCGADFKHPEVVTVQRAGEPSMDVETCPNCGNTDIEDEDEGWYPLYVDPDGIKPEHLFKEN